VTNELFGTPTAVYNLGNPETISYTLSDGYMIGTSGPFNMNIRT